MSVTFRVRHGKALPRMSLRYRWQQLQLHDCLDVPIDDDPDAGLRALRAAYAYGRRHGQKFTGRIVRERNARFMRIWRTD